MMNKAKPVRTCIACRRQSDKGDFIRIVRNAAGNIEIDLKGKLPGRGAYVCGNAECVKQTAKGNRLSKALKCQVPVEILKSLEELLPLSDE
jgi:uncharacterized protein